MGSALNQIIATAFTNANSGPSPGTRFVAAKNARQDLDSVLTSRESANQYRDLSTQALQQQIVDEQEVRRLLGDYATNQQGMSEWQQAAPIAAGNFAQSVERGGVNPDLSARALEMLQRPGVELQESQQRIINQLAQRDPNVRAALMGQMFPQTQKPQSVVGKIQADRQAAIARGASPDEIAAYDDALAKATAINPGVNVTVPITNEPPVQQKQEDKDFGAFLVSDFDAVQKAADAAAENLQQLYIQRTLKPETGSLEGIKAAGGALAEAIGLPLDEDALAQIESVQSFKAITGNLLAAKLASQKGPQTDDDARRMKETLASIDNVEAANDFILRSSIATETRKVEMSDFAREWKTATGSFDGWRAAWGEFKRKTPLLGINPTTNKPVFYTEFMEEAAKANPGATRDQLLEMWRNKYG